MPFFAEQLPHMPRLVFEVLQLKKEQTIQQLSQKQSVTDPVRERRAWYRGLGSALFVMMGTFAILGYTHWVILSQFVAAAAALAVTGGLITLRNLNRSS